MTVETLHPAPAPAVSRLGQATAVEQSRAVAEVAAAVQVAQMCPRDVQAATSEMRRACAQPRLADRAFFRFNRGDGMVTGPSVYLARELARCWGNLQAGVAELRRDDEHGQSEMQAWAWDVQTNSRTSTTFIVPHARDTKKGRKDLTELRDVYENNANNAARRLREMILALLPQWFVEEAKDICTATIRDGGGKSLAERVTEAVGVFEAEFRIDRARLEKRIGYSSSAWTAHDVATLRVIFSSLRRGEIRVEDEFPTDAGPTVTAADLGAPAAPAAAKAPGGDAAAAAPTTADAAAPAEPAEAPQDEPISRPQWDAINARFAEMRVQGDGQKAARAGAIRTVLDLPQLDIAVMTAAQAQFVLDQLVGDAGVVMVADILTRNGAPAHLIPALPEPEPTTGEGLDGGPLPGEVAGDPVPSPGEIDPTAEDDWPGAQAHADDAARDEAAG